MSLAIFPRSGENVVAQGRFHRLHKGSSWIYLFLFITPCLVYWPYLNDWFFLVDDGVHLLQAALYSPWQYFIQPKAVQLGAYGTVTPLLTLSFDFDFTLFGVHVIPFRIHQFLDLSIATILGFYLLRRCRVQRIPALVGVLLFLFIAPVSDIADRLAARQYIEGLILILISLIAYLNAQDKWRHKSWLWASLLAYVLAILAKEVFVPFPLIVIATSRGGIRKRISGVAPFIIILILYVAYRFYILGGSAAYVKAAINIMPRSYMDASIYGSLLKIPLYTFRIKWLTWIALLLALSLLAVCAYKKKVNWLLLISVLFALLIPIIALLPQISFWGFHSSVRWYMLAGCAFCILVPIGISFLEHGFLRNFFIAVFISILLLTAWKVTIPRIGSHFTYNSQLAKAIWEANDNRYISEFLPGSATPDDAVWRYLSYTVKGVPGTFFVGNIGIFNWLPQNGKHGVKLIQNWPPKKNSQPVLIPYHGANIKYISAKKRIRILQSMSIENNLFYLTCNGSSKRVFFLVDKPFYVHYPFFCGQSRPFDISRIARATGIHLNRAIIVIGEQINGDWKYTKPIPYKKIERYGLNNDQFVNDF